MKNYKYHDVAWLLRQGYDPDEVDNLLAEEELRQPTHTAAPRDTSGTSSEPSRRIQKSRRDAVRRARRLKMDSRLGDEKSPRKDSE